MQTTIAIKEGHLQEGAPIEEEMIKEEAHEQTAVAAIASEQGILTEELLEAEIPKPLETHSLEMTLNFQETAIEMATGSQEITGKIQDFQEGIAIEMATGSQEKAEIALDFQETTTETKADSQEIAEIVRDSRESAARAMNVLVIDQVRQETGQITLIL